MDLSTLKPWSGVLAALACGVLAGCAAKDDGSGGGAPGHRLGRQVQALDPDAPAPPAPPAPECVTDEDCATSNVCLQARCLPNGKCVSTPVNNVACDDGNPCTVDDTCNGGSCSGQQMRCAPDTDCATNACNRATGQCEATPKPDGIACHDTDPCTTGETCLAGDCKPARTTVCLSADECQIASCDGNGGCNFTPQPDGHQCDDGNNCTVGEACSNGVCTGGEEPPILVEQCYVGHCDPATGDISSVPADDGTPCDDGNACTTGEKCQQARCTGGTTPTTCDTPPPCHLPGGECAQGLTECNYPPAPDGTACDDGDPCTEHDVCNNGVCGGTPGPTPVGSVTRTLGFFATHIRATQACLDDGGAVTVGDLHIETIESALGLLWANPGQYDDRGGVRSQYDRSQLILARQYFVAVCNGRLFGTTMSSTLRNDAQSTLEGSDCVDETTVAAELDAFNSSGDAQDLPPGFNPGRADPQGARALADDPTSPSGNSCSTGGAP